MKKNIIMTMALGLAAALVITNTTPVAAFAAAPSDNDTGWVDVVEDDDDLYAEDENGEFHSRDYYDDDEFYGEDENGEFHSRDYVNFSHGFSATHGKSSQYNFGLCDFDKFETLTAELPTSCPTTYSQVHL